MFSHGLSLIGLNLMAYISDATRTGMFNIDFMTNSDVMWLLLNAKITFSQGGCKNKHLAPGLKTKQSRFPKEQSCLKKRISTVDVNRSRTWYTFCNASFHC